MAITRTGTFASQSFILAQVNNSLAKYVNTQEQVSTGQKTQRYVGIADQSALAIDLSNTQENLDQYKKTADAVNSRLAASHTALSDVLDVVSKFRAQLIQGLTANQSTTARLDTVAEGYLKQVEASLNTDLGGVYLFGGIKSDEAPVDLSNPVTNQNGQYYSGADELLSARVDENTIIQYGATANRDGFAKLISALQRVASAAANQTELETGLDEVNVALDDLTQLEAEMGHNMAVVEAAQGRNEALKATVVTQLGSIRDIDISAAMVELTQRQTVLQASYMVITRASQLSLTNFL